MKLQRQIFVPAGAAQSSAALHDLVRPGVWVVEAGCTPPPAHRPSRLLAHLGMQHGLAASLRTATLLGINLGSIFSDRLTEAGCLIDALADVALHEILLNATIHGNLRIASGPAAEWHDLALRESRIGAALQDATLAGRMVTLAGGWTGQRAAAVIIDEGEGYRPSDARPVANPARRGAGRGLVIARATAQVHVLRGGRCTRLIFTCLAPAEGRP